MVICKQPEIGGAVPPHQDSTFLFTEPPSAVGYLYALEDATKENGCLSFAAGSQRRSPITKRFVRTGEKGREGTNLVRPNSLLMRMDDSLIKRELTIHHLDDSTRVNTYSYRES